MNTLATLQLQRVRLVNADLWARIRSLEDLFRGLLRLDEVALLDFVVMHGRRSTPFVDLGESGRVEPGLLDHVNGVQRPLDHPIGVDIPESALLASTNTRAVAREKLGLRRMHHGP